MAGNRERFSVQRAMVITQIAVSMVLLVGALLFVRSYRNLMTLNPGMSESGILVGFFGFRSANIKPENEAAYKRQLVEDVRSLPGIENAAATTNVPLKRQHLGTRSGDRLAEWAEQIYLRLPQAFSPPWAFRCSTDATSPISDTNDTPSGADRQPDLCPEVCSCAAAARARSGSAP